MIAVLPAIAGVGAIQACLEAPRRAFDRIEAEMLAQPQVEIPPTHIFADGIYARQITIPAGTLLSGKIHRASHINVVSKGEISVYTEGEGVKRIVAPAIFVAPAGTRRLGWAHTETIWATIHANAINERDLALLEEWLIAPHPVALADDSLIQQLKEGDAPCTN